MLSTIQKWGNSQGIRIPKVILDSVQWKENEEVALTAENGKIIIEKAKKRKTIVELFEGYKGDYQPEEIDWGSPRGDEVW